MDVGEGMCATSPAELASCVEAITGLAVETCSEEIVEIAEMEEMEVVLGVNVGKSKLEPRGLFL